MNMPTTGDGSIERQRALMFALSRTISGDTDTDKLNVFLAKPCIREIINLPFPSDRPLFPPTEVAAESQAMRALLLGYGAHVQGKPPSALPIVCGHGAVLQSILSAGGDPNAVVDVPALTGGTYPAGLLSFTCLQRRENTDVEIGKVVKVLIAAGAKVNVHDIPSLHGPFKPDSALTAAICRDMVDAVEELLQGGACANVETRMRGGYAPLLYCACQDGRTRIVQSLLMHGARVDDTDPDGWTPLMMASQFGHLEIVKLLLRHGANVNHHEQSSNRTALMEACYNSHTAIVNVLLDQRPCLDAVRIDGSSCLHIAAEVGSVDIVAALIKAGANLEVVNTFGATALHVAITKRHGRVIEKLAKAGSNVDAPFPVQLPLGLQGSITARGMVGVACPEDVAAVLQRSVCQKCGVGRKEALERGNKIQKCGRWQRVGYCSKECQQSDWAAHKQVCAPRTA